MNRLHLPVLLVTLGVAAITASASTAYIPAPGTGNLQPTASVQWATDFWFDDNKATLPGHLTQTAVAVEAEYGLAPNLGIDATIGYSTVNYQGGQLAPLTLITDGTETRS